MDQQMAMGIPLESVAHIIQVALTPVFLLSGISGLLNVITARLGRVTDDFNAACLTLRSADPADASTVHRSTCQLHRRLRILESARGLAALAGIGTCAATFALFLGALQNTAVATALFLMFGGAVLCTTGALFGFAVEVLLSTPPRPSAPIPSAGGRTALY